MDMDANYITSEIRRCRTALEAAHANYNPSVSAAKRRDHYETIEFWGAKLSNMEAAAKRFGITV